MAARITKIRNSKSEHKTMVLCSDFEFRISEFPYQLA
jgi:hypothetical protein